MPKNVGEKIRAARLEKGIKQVELARRMGVKPQMIGQYERGCTNPKIETLSKIADALDVPLANFIDTYDLSPLWASIKNGLPEPENEDERLVPCLVNVITWDLSCTPYFPDESYGEYVSPAVYDTEQKIFSVGRYDCETTINALLDPDDISGKSGSRVTHWMEYPSPFGYWDKTT